MTTFKWKQELPVKQGWYWHWNGDADSAPLPVSVMYSGTGDNYFVSRGQLGLDHAIDCSQFGGWWSDEPIDIDPPRDPLASSPPAVEDGKDAKIKALGEQLEIGQSTCRGLLDKINNLLTALASRDAKIGEMRGALQIALEYTTISFKAFRAKYADQLSKHANVDDFMEELFTSALSLTPAEQTKTGSPHENLDRLWVEQSVFSQITFGADKDRGPVGPLNHLAKEAKEAAEAPTDIEEYADCFLLLLDATRRGGWRLDELVGAAQAKLEKNKNRKWGLIGEDGAIHHLKTDPVSSPLADAERKVVEADYPWAIDAMKIINKLTPSIEGKAFDPDWFLLRQRFEKFEASLHEVANALEMFCDFHGGGPIINFTRKYNMPVSQIETLEFCISRGRAAVDALLALKSSHTQETGKGVQS